MLELCVFASKREFFLKNYLLYVAQVAPGVGVFVPIFCPTPGALARICHCSCDKCPWVPGGHPLGMAADTRINDMEIPETKLFIPKGFELGTTLS